MVFNIFTTTGADASLAQYRERISTGKKILENTRDFPEIITSTGAKFWGHICPSVPYWSIFGGFNFRGS